MNARFFNALDSKIQNIWSALGQTGPEFVLVGGTAIAYQLGHRVSYDIELSSSKPIGHPRMLRRKWNCQEVGQHKVLRRNPDNYVKFFPTASAPKIDVHGKLMARGCLELPSIADNGLRIASLTDLLAQKLMAMTERDAQRDAFDVTALIRDGRAELELAISAACDETGYGLGEDCADRLGLKLLDTEVMP